MKLTKIRFTSWRDQTEAPWTINEDLQTIEAPRTFLLSAEETAARAETRAATDHPKVGTFGYQVLDETRNRNAMVVDEAGDYLPAQALFTFGVVDEDPPLPQWAKDGKFGRFE